MTTLRILLIGGTGSVGRKVAERALADRWGGLLTDRLWAREAAAVGGAR